MAEYKPLGNHGRERLYKRVPFDLGNDRIYPPERRTALYDKPLRGKLLPERVLECWESVGCGGFIQ